VVPVLLIANMMLGIYYNLTVWFKLSDKTGYGTYISFGGALITIILNLILIPILGYMGSAIATLICYTAMAVACYLLGAKHYPIPYKTGKILGYIAVALGISGLFSFYFAGLQVPFVVSLFIRAVLIAVFCGLVWFSETRKPFMVKTG
jgi:O-antigen/teichoic acid export membrane protein